MPSKPANKLFDNIKRSDSSHAQAKESTFQWLNRADRDDCARAREVLEDWYSCYPDVNEDLRKRFRKRNEGQHIGAWWELYVYTLYRLLGYRVAVHPPVPGSRRKPDFLVERDATSTYVECAVVFAGDYVRKLTAGVEEYIRDYINTLTNPNFFVGLRISQRGKQQPKATDITRPLEDWLATLDADDVLADIASGKAPPKTEMSVRDWKLVYTAFPKNPDKRGKSRSLLGLLESSRVSAVNDVEQLRDTLSEKGAHYGTPDKPFVVAVLNKSPFGGEDDMTDAVFGTIAVQGGGGLPTELVRKPDGYWRGTAGGDRVSGVLFGQNLNPWSVATVLPRMWINPWASRPITEANPFGTFTVNNDWEVVPSEWSRTADAIFGLPTGWPN